MATFRKRGTKWQVQIRLHGKACSRTFSTKNDAEAWARLTEVSIERSLAGLGPQVTLTPSAETPVPPVTLLSLLERYEKVITARKRGHVSERYRLRNLKGHRIASLTIDRLTSAEVAAYRDDRLTKVQGPSVRRELTILRHCLKVAASEWGISHLETNPVASIGKPSDNRARDRRLTEEDAQKIAESLKVTRSPYIKHAITFAVATGMRRGEILSLTWANVDKTNRVALLPMTKNGESRSVPLTKLALIVLEELEGMEKGNKRSGFVFPISANALRLSWERLKKRAGVKDLRFHDLRHEAISRFFELGLSIPEVSLISGHKDPRMLFRYTHLRAADVATKLHQLAEGGGE